jgi:hypothetical protein
MPTRPANRTKPLSPTPTSSGPAPAATGATPVSGGPSIGSEPISRLQEYGTPGRIDRMYVTAEECRLYMRTGRGAIQYLNVHLSANHANYNALYSLLLSCWINEAPIYAMVKDQLVLDRVEEPGTIQIKHVNLVSAEVGSYAESQADW